MKIAVVCPYDLGRPGGVQHQSASLVEWLRAAGHEAWLVGPGDGGQPGTRSVGRPIVVPVSGTRAPLGVGRGLRRGVAAAVADADVVHVHEPFMPFVSVAALLADTPPKVGTFHADPPRWARSAYSLGSPAVRRLLGRLAAVTAVSPVAAAAVAAIAEVTIVPNGVDGDRLRAEVARDPRRVAFIGRDEPRKGLDVLLRAWTEVRAAVPEAELVAFGPRRGSGPAGVTFASEVDDRAKAVLLSSSAVLCAPNLGGESFGIVLVEGMSAGCAVVASGLPAFVAVGGDAAVYAAPGDPRGLAAAIVDLLTDGDRWRSVHGRSLERAATFDRAAVLDRYLEVYERAAAT